MTEHRNRKTWHWAVCSNDEEGAVEYDEDGRAHIYFSEDLAGVAADALRLEDSMKRRVDKVEIEGL